jgi:protein translocase SecG subunit
MIIPILQIIVTVALVALILLQERSSGLSGIFGGEGSVYQTRRGLEKGIFIGTIVLACAFVALAVINLVR